MRHHPSTIQEEASGRRVVCLILLVVSAGGFPSWCRGQQVEIPPELQNPQTTVAIRADSQEKDHDTLHLLGHVEVVYKDMKLHADEGSFNEANGDLHAKGHIEFSDAISHLEAVEAFYNVQTGMGWFTDVRGTVHTRITPRARMLLTGAPFSIRAARIERQSESVFIAEHARMTTCDCEEKGWSFDARRARIVVGDRVLSRHATFRLLRVPLFYTPVTVNSIAREPRQTGFLLPHAGHSSQKGFIFGGGFFWAINPSADLLLGVEDFSLRGVARNARFRAQPSATSKVSIEYTGINDRGSGPKRAIRASGQSVRAIGEMRDMGYGFRGVVNVDYITSLIYRETWATSFTEAVSSEANQTGFATKNFSTYSLNFYVSRYQNFLTAAEKVGNSVILRQTPSLDFSSMDRQLAKSPFYFAFDFSTTGVGRTEPGLDLPQLSERVDFHPEITLRSKPFLGFHFTPTFGVRATHYGTSLEPGHDPLTRLLGEIGLDLRPPSFARVFDHPYHGRRFKHVFEPQIRYRLVRARQSDSLDDVVRFDQVDILAETNEFEYSLTNSLLVRKDAPEGAGDPPQARELVSWRISQKYYFDPTFGGMLEPGKRVVFDPTISLTGFAFAQGRRFSPIVSVVKLSPFSSYDTELRADFDPTGGGVLNAGIASHIRRGPLRLSLTDFFINRTAALSTSVIPSGNLSKLPSFHLLRAVASYGDVNRKGLSGAFGVDFNFAQRIAHQAVSQVSYNFGCFALDFEYRRLALGALRRENQFRVALSLANIGTFGNLKPREKLY